VGGVWWQPRITSTSAIWHRVHEVHADHLVGRFVATPISVIEMLEVFEARIVAGGDRVELLERDA
jgi:hypothetical protein